MPRAATARSPKSGRRWPRRSKIPRSASISSRPNPGKTIRRHRHHGGAHPAQPRFFDPAALDRLAQALAPYIGPIAKVVVTRAARTARSAEELQNALAAEIPPRPTASASCSRRSAQLGPARSVARA